MYKEVAWWQFNPGRLAKKFTKKRHDGWSTVCEGFCSLDTETSHIEEQAAWIYQWCFSYPDGEDRLLVYGRTPEELVYVLEKVHYVNQLDENNKLIFFVHNLSYDYTYFHNFLDGAFDHEGVLLAVGAHKIISYNQSGLEFRDSLKIAQRGLDTWCKDLGTKHRKLVGAVDYAEVRYQEDPLYKDDWRYMFRDVVCLDECIEKQMELYGDTIWTMPLTNTGYVRREARRKFKADKKNWDYFTGKALTLEQYDFCHKEFAGGLTHGNRFCRDVKQTGKIRHRDFASHYPSQQMVQYCPASKFTLYYDSSVDRGDCTVDELMGMVDDCFLAAICFKDMTLKKGITLPVAQFCKFHDGAIGEIKCINDNGRILKMDGASIVVVNELDLKWLVKQYTFSYKVIKVYTAARGRFPKYLRDTVNEFFYKKSFYKSECKKLKTQFGEDSEEYRNAYLQMMISKGMLNSIYGMSATDPVRYNYYEDEDGVWHHDHKDDEEREAALEKFFHGRNNFMNYELGLWTTAHARNELLEFVELIGYENFIYADTDSIFYFSTSEIEDRIEAKNAEFRAQDEAEGWFIEVDGKKSYYNQFEDEDEDIVEFKFLHSKCYAYVTADGELSVTVAGVRKRGRNGNTRKKELGSIDNLDYGMTFHDCGGTIVKYTAGEVRPRTVYINDHIVSVSQWGIITDTTKEIKSDLESREGLYRWEVSDSYDD